MITFAIWLDTNRTKQEWRNLWTLVETKYPDLLPGNYDYTTQDRIDILNAELKSYNAEYNHDKMEIIFETEQDLMFFKLRFS